MGLGSPCTHEASGGQELRYICVSMCVSVGVCCVCACVVCVCVNIEINKWETREYYEYVVARIITAA